MTHVENELEIADDEVLEIPPGAIAGRSSHERTIAVELTEGDGRTIEARIAPYDTVAVVADPPDYRPYRERFARGAFDAQMRAAHSVKVWLNFEHDQGLRGIVGHASTIADDPAGPIARFRVHPNADGDKALQLVNDGLLTGLSIEFAALRSKIIDGIVTRTKVHIDKVSLCRTPAYADARVLAVREQDHAAADDDESSSALTVVRFEAPAPIDEPMLDKLAALGIETRIERLTGDAG